MNIYKQIVGHGWHRYKSEAILPPGEYYHIPKPAQEQKKQLGLVAASDPNGRFYWLAPADDWVRWFLAGQFVRETPFYGLDEPIGAENERTLGRAYESAWQWQKRFVQDGLSCLRRGLQYRRGAVVSLGGGKTLPSLMLAQFADNPVVLAPRHIHDTWKRAATAWGLHCPPITTYESAHRIAGKPDCLICDEILRCKNPEAARSEAALELSRTAEVAVGLTGIPTGGNGPLDWRWLGVLRPGCVPMSENPWRHFFSDETILKEVAPGKKAYFTPAESWNREKIAGFVAPFIMRVDTSELLAHLPPVRFETFTCPQPKDWNAVVHGVATDKGPSKRVSQARMLSDGFILDDLGNAVWLHKDKIRIVEEFVESAGEPVIVAAAWRETIAELARVLAPYNPAVVSGETHDCGAALARFLGRQTPVLILNSRYGEGIDGLQEVTRLLLVVSNSPMPTDRPQLIGRVFRQGQNHGVVVTDILGEGTMDARVLELVTQHGDMNDSMVTKILAEEFL